MNKLKLYIGNLPYQMETAHLKESFEKFGEIVDVVVIKDRESGRSRGFGFVTYAEETSAGAALQAMNGEVIRVDHSELNTQNHVRQKPSRNDLCQERQEKSFQSLIRIISGCVMPSS